MDRDKIQVQDPHFGLIDFFQILLNRKFSCIFFFSVRECNFPEDISMPVKELLRTKYCEAECVAHG